METLDRITELSMLYEISALPTRLKDLDKIARLAVDKAVRLLGSDMAVCYLYQPRQKVLYPQAARGVRASRLPTVSLEQLPAPIQQTITEKRPLAWCVETMSAVPDLLGGRYALQAAISAPLRVEEELLGLLYAVRLQPRPFSVAELALYGVLADRVASAVADARAYRLLERRVAELRALNEVGSILAHSQDMEELLVHLQVQVNQVLDADNFFVSLMEEDGSAWVTMLEVEGGQRRPAERHPREAGLTGYILRTGTPLLFATRAELEAFMYAQGIVGIGTPASSWLGVPIRSGEQIVGVIVVQSYAHEHRYDADDQLLLTTIANQVAVALENVRLVGQLRRMVEAHAHRAMRLRAAVEVAESIATILDLETLLPQVVQVIQTRFDLHYVGLFLVDESGKWAVLRAGTGEAGAALLAAGHRLEVNEDSLIGAAISQQRACLALDANAEGICFSTPYVSETRSEMALPLVGRGGVIGAMTIQSTREQAFSEEDITVLQTLANQIAVAIDNARLFAASQAALDEALAVQQRYFGQAWHAYLRETPFSGYRQTREGAQSLAGTPLPEVQQVLARGGQPLVERDPTGASRLVVPIKLREQIIGALGFKREESEHAWTEDELALVEAIAEQFALAAENLRLLDETQRRAARERLTREITDKMRRALSMEELVATAAQELAAVFGTQHTFVQLVPETSGARSSEGPSQREEV